MKQKSTFTRRDWLTLAGLGTFLFVAPACGGDDGGETRPVGGTTPPAPTAPTAPTTPGAPTASGAGAGPRWVVATSFVTADQTETYLVTTKSLAADATLDPTRGPKLLGGVVPRVHAGAVYVPEANRIVRYNVNAQDELTKSAEFQVPGVTELQSWHMWIVSDTKAYVFDPAGLRLVIWNPSTMTLAGKQIDLPQIARPGLSANLVLEDVGPSKRGNQLLIPLAWTDQDENSRYASGVLVLDTATDTVVAVDESERCGEAYATLEAANGDVYFFPPSWSAAPHFFFDAHRPTCVLKVPAGKSEFDETAPLDLSKLGTGSAAAGAMPDGANGFYFTSANEAAWDNGENEGGPFWEVWHYDFASAKSQKVEGLPLWSGELYYVDVGGELLVPYWETSATGQQNTTLYSLKPGLAPQKRLRFASNWYGVSKLR
ncbi:MAG: hypothetical protein ABW252_14755 [Polyangiales bacterium]